MAVNVKDVITGKLSDVMLIYDSLIDLAREIEVVQLRWNVLHQDFLHLTEHVKRFIGVLKKDLVIRRPSTDILLNLNTEKMTLEEWNEFVNQSTSSNSPNYSDSPNSSIEETIEERIEENIKSEKSIEERIDITIFTR
jgi:hypothetical protein